LNEEVANAGDKEAIKRRIKGYAFGHNGYPVNLKKAVELIKRH